MMGMTMTQKYWQRMQERSRKRGDLIVCQLDRILANDITAPPAIEAFRTIGKPVFDAKNRPCARSFYAE